LDGCCCHAPGEVPEGGDDHGDGKVGHCFGGGEAGVAVDDPLAV
jgi:hypothetical protein